MTNARSNKLFPKFLFQKINNILEMAEIIRSYVPNDRSIRTKFRKYTLSDEFFIFYFTT